MRWQLWLILGFLGTSVNGFGQSLTILTEVVQPAQIKNSDGSLSGFAVDVVREIQKRVQNSDPIRLGLWEQIYQEALKKPNILLFTTNRTAVRLKLFQWCGPLYDSITGLYTWKNSPLQVKSLDEARTLELIGVYAGEPADQKLTALGFKNLDRTTSAELNLKKFLNHRFEVFTAGSMSIGDRLKAQGHQPDEVRLLLGLMQVQGYLAFSLGTDPAIVRQWQASLDEIRADGTMAKIYLRYGVNLPGPALEPLP